MDKDFLRINAAGIPHAGIVYCRQGKRRLGGIIQGLTEIWEVMEPEEMGLFWIACAGAIITAP